MKTLNVLLLEPYLTGSHKSWAEEYARYSNHTVTTLSLPGRFWKWRMHGGAVTLAKQFLALESLPDVILATDMLNLATFQALTRHCSYNIPCAIYFHENQLTYPWSPTDRDVKAKRDNHYSFVNYVSALAADAVLFNSPYHLAAFFEALPKFLKHFPDFNELDSVAELKNKAQVLPLGLDLRRFDLYKPSTPPIVDSPPVILWNHRWEYDKNPSDFFNALYVLADEGLEFKVVILGENFRNAPTEFAIAQERLTDRIIHIGYANDFETYARFLWQADILPVTSYHDFFGASVVQAMYCGCYPLLPKRLVYPDLISTTQQPSHLYKTQEDLVEKLKQVIKQRLFLKDTGLQDVVKQFDWSILASQYDQILTTA